jgi:hypothetical protein
MVGNMKKTQILFLLVGSALLALLFIVFDIREMVKQIITFGDKFWICVVIYLPNHILMAYGWMVLVSFKLRAKDFFRILLARIAGDATTTFNAAASIAGEALKAIYIQDIVPFKIGLASVVMDRLIHVTGSILLILTGIFIGFFKLDLPLWSMGVMFLIFMAILLLLFFIIRKQRSGFLAFVIGKFPLFLRKRILSGERAKKIASLDQEIGLIFRNRKNLNHFYISLFMHTIPVLISGTIEIYVIMKFAGGNATILDSMFVYLFGLFIAAVTFFVPLNIGTSEGSYVIALYFLGYPNKELGVTIGFIRRIRSILWSGIGLALLFHKGLVGGEKR